jgi:hypothetical protein
MLHRRKLHVQDDPRSVLQQIKPYLTVGQSLLSAACDFPRAHGMRWAEIPVRYRKRVSISKITQSTNRVTFVIPKWLEVAVGPKTFNRPS